MDRKYSRWNTIVGDMNKKFTILLAVQWYMVHAIHTTYVHSLLCGCVCVHCFRQVLMQKNWFNLMKAKYSAKNFVWFVTIKVKKS